MKEVINGMKLLARTPSGEKIEHFKVFWIGQLAFGVINEWCTNREILELYLEDSPKIKE